MACKTDNFVFDPDKTALENFFALIYRTNRVKLHPRDVDLELPRDLAPGEDDDGDNTKILVKGKPGGMYSGQKDLFYARADIETHYPVFQIDAAETVGINDKDALLHYLDGKFNLVDGEFDVDIEEPFESLLFHTHIDIFAKDTSLIYIGRKSIHVFWSGGIRRITDDGQIRVTEDGQLRIIGDLIPYEPA